MTERAMELLSLTDNGFSLILDIGYRIYLWNKK